MKQDVVCILQEMVNVLSQPDYLGIIDVVISFFALITTFVLIIFNYRAIKIAQTEIQKSMDTQLYDRRFMIINHIEKDDYSNSITEIDLLFGNTIKEKVSQLVNLTNEIVSYNREKQEYYNLLRDCTDPEAQRFYHLYMRDNVFDQGLSFEEEKELNELFEFYGVLTFTDEESGIIEYDIDYIQESLEDLKEEFTALKKEVLADFSDFMKKTLPATSTYLKS